MRHIPHPLRGLAPLAAVACVSCAPTAAAAARPTPSFLLAADPAAANVQVFNADGRLTGQLDDVQIAAHAGTIQLTDGRVLAVDNAHHRLLAVTVNNAGVPRVARTANIPSDEGEEALWLAVDPTQRFLAIASANEEQEGAATISLVDLRSYRVRQFEPTLRRDSTGAYNEPEVLLTAPPRRLVVTTGGRFSAFSVQAIMAGEKPRLLGSAPVGDFTHGPAITPDGRRVITTTATGVDSAQVRRTGLTARPRIPYATDRTVGQNFRPRLSTDGTVLYGSVWEADHFPAEDWATMANSVSVVNLKSNSARLVPLDTGLTFITRFGLSRRYAAFVTQQPDQDVVSLVDVRSTSTTRDQVVKRVTLPRLVNGPVPGVTWRGTQTRSLAITPSGDRVFVSAGGQGTIDEIDSTTGHVVRTLTAASPLDAGGYLTVVRKGTPLTDLMGR